MIDFSTVKSIVIPEGEVSIIARGSEVLWRKQKYKCEVEYLESTGTQWIDALFSSVADDAIRVTQTFQFTKARSGTSQVEGMTGGQSQCFWGINSSNNGFYYGLSETERVAYTDTLGGTLDKHTMELISENGISTIVRDGSVIFTGNLGKPTLPRILMFGCWRSTSSAVYCRNYIKIFRQTFEKNGTTVRDFIPVLDWNDRPCMYDKVTDELFYNQGTGEFIAGRQIHPVEWLESTGTQYIDTGYKETGNTSKLVFKTKVNGVGDVIGNTTAYANGQKLVGINSSRKSFLYYKPTGSRVLLENPSRITGDVLLTATFLKSNTTMTMDNGTDINSGTYSGLYNDATYALFYRRTSSGILFYGKLYFLEIYDNGTLIRDYIPAHDENGVGFMFDRVTHTIFDNAGTGEFLYGTEVAA